MSLDVRTEQRLRRIERLMTARLVLLLAILGAALALARVDRSFSDGAEVGLYGTIVFSFLSSVVFAATFPRFGQASRFGAALIATDLITISALVHFTGGSESVFAPLFVLVVVCAAVLFGRAGGYLAAALAATSFGAVLVAERIGVLRIYGGVPPVLPVEVAHWAVQAGAQVVVGLLASGLSRELDRTGEDLERSRSDLRRLRSLHERTVGSLLSGLLTTDTTGIITSFNPEAEHITAISEELAVGRAIEDVLPGARERVMRPAEVGRTGRTRAQILYKNRLGATLHLGLSGSILREADGSAVGHVVIFQDVTQVVEMEGELRRSERQAAIGRLSAAIAHEIRNPLAAISGSIQMLRSASQAAGDDDSRRLMEIVLRETERLDGLITDFLQYARPAPPKLGSVSLAPLVQDLVQMFEKSRSRENPIEVRVEVKEGLAVTGDASQLPAPLEPLPQRSPGDARGWSPSHRRKPCAPVASRRCARGPKCSRGGGDALSGARGGRHRRGDCAGGDRPHLRSLFHHPKRGIGPRSCHRSPDRREPRRIAARRKYRGCRHDVSHPTPPSRGATVSTKARILVVDDERSMQEFLEILLRREGYDVTCVGDVDGALLALESDDFDVVISDLQMPGKTGLDLLHALREASPETVALVMTAFASTETAIAAMKEGAYDYLTKPFQVDEIRLVLEKALEKKLLARENRRLRSELRSQIRQRALIGSGSAMQRVYELIGQVAETKANVLISGESGTGKELVARAIHAASDRRDRPFVALNCGAIPENLLESELFGHVKGAFTGAVQNKEGLFETADTGTLFLDEVGELPSSLQVKLLRAIQEKAIRRVGGINDRRVDVRILAATNRRLEEEVAAGRFREDLYYRLNVIQIGLPPLRERPEDVPLLVKHFVEKYA